MCAGYVDVLQRLKEERKRLLWSQDEISRYVHINQGNYCKVENGNRRLGYYEIKELYKTDIDVNYIFSGRRSSYSYTKLIGDCDYRDAFVLFNVIASIISYHWCIEQTEFWRDMYHQVKFVRLIDINRIEQQNLFLLVRLDLSYLQSHMAKLLEVDIKKLRDLEKDKCLPDSELLWLMYDRFHIPPAAILKDAKGLLGEMGCLLESMAEVVGEESIDIIKILKKEGESTKGESFSEESAYFRR